MYKDFSLEYIQDIFHHYKETETKYLPLPNYMKLQRHITERNRSILIDWIIDIHQKIKYERETIFLCVNIIDRILSINYHVTPKELHLIGLTALVISAKINETKFYGMKDYERFCNCCYSVKDIIKMELTICTKLKFAFLIVSPNQLISVMLLCIKHYDITLQKKFQSVCEFLTEIALMYIKMLNFPPSKLAASAIYYAAKILLGNEFSWMKQFRSFIGYMEEDILECVETYVLCLKRYFDDNKFTAIKRKFAIEKDNEIGATYLVKRSMSKLLSKSNLVILQHERL